MKETTVNTIRVERARMRITQGDLAVGANLSRQAIHAFETGKICPSATSALKIVRYFNELRVIEGKAVLNFEDIFKLNN